MRRLSSVLALWVTFATGLAAHEVYPTVMTIEQQGAKLTFVMGPDGLGANLEAFVAGVDLTAVADINDAENADEFDALRAMPPAEFEEAFRAYWPELTGNIRVRASDGALPLTLDDLTVPEVGNVEFLRPSVVTFSAQLPEGVETVVVEWDSVLGGLVLRQEGVENPYDAYLTGGEPSAPIAVLPAGSSSTLMRVALGVILIGGAAAAVLARRALRQRAT